MTDLQLRESVEYCRWEEGRYLSAPLVDLRQEKRLPDETIRQTLIELGQAQAEPMLRIPRRADMSA